MLNVVLARGQTGNDPGYEPVGLEGSPIDATLLGGSSVALHSDAWTEFEIERGSQRLLVKTWGTEPHTEVDLETNPAGVVSRTPSLVGHFAGNPKGR